MITKIDWYIIRNFVGTLFFMLILLIVIFVVVDYQNHSQEFSENGFSTIDTLRLYYPYYVIWAANLFASILVFISVIFFTSRLANNTEIVAITSSGTSFFRFSRPYLIVAIMIGIVTLFSNHFFLPWANIKRNDFNIKTLTGNRKVEYYSNKNIASQISPNEYLFINNYNRETKRGNRLIYQKFNDKKALIHEIRADEVSWSSTDNKYILTHYFEKTLTPQGKIAFLSSGMSTKRNFYFTPEELLPDAFVAENMNTFKLKEFIKKEKMKGSGNINAYLNELYQRTSSAVAVVILTFLALSLSSTKRRGGIGINLAIGICSAFAYIFSFQALKILSANGVLSPWLAVWLPNFIFGIITIILYLKRAYA